MNSSNITNASLYGDDVQDELSPEQLKRVEILLVVCKIFSLFITISTTWITICMIAYGNRRRKWNRKSESGQMYIACFIPFTLSIPRFVLDHVRFYDRTNPRIMNNCELIADVSDFVCVFAILATYIFLWMKQKAIYAHAFMEAINKKPIRLFSWGLLVFICASSVAFLCGFIIPLDFRASPHGCIEINPGEGPAWATAKFYVLGVLTAIWQVSLVGLFVYPMIKNRHKFARGPSVKNPKDERNVISATIHRSIICTGIAIFSDSTVTLLGVLAIPWSYPAVIRYTMYDVSIFINLICIISTFAQNKLIITVFCRRRTSNDFTMSRNVATSAGGSAQKNQIIP